VQEEGASFGAGLTREGQQKNQEKEEKGWRRRGWVMAQRSSWSIERKTKEPPGDAKVPIAQRCSVTPKAKIWSWKPLISKADTGMARKTG